MLPSTIGELEISVEMPADVRYMMPDLCRSHRHGVDQFSADIDIFNKDLSKVLLSVTDFQTSPLEMDYAGDPDGKRSIFDVDQADITAEVHWNYLLDLMEPAEISQVVLDADTTTTDGSLIQVSSRGSFQR